MNEPYREPAPRPLTEAEKQEEKRRLVYKMKKVTEQLELVVALLKLKRLMRGRR